jgi:BTB/POZ domain
MFIDDEHTFSFLIEGVPAVALSSECSIVMLKRGIVLKKSQPSPVVDNSFRTEIQLDAGITSQLRNDPNGPIMLELIIDRRHLFDKFYQPSKLHSEVTESLFGDPIYSDFVFSVKGRAFRVHRCILGKASSVMRAMFASLFCEAERKHCKIDEFEPEVFDLLLKFIYGAPLPPGSSSKAKKLYEMAEYYDIESLKNICLNKIIETLSVATSLDVYCWAELHKIDILTMKAWIIIKR